MAGLRTVALDDEDWKWVLRFLVDIQSMTKTPSREAKAKQIEQDIRGWLPDAVEQAVAPLD